MRARRGWGWPLVPVYWTGLRVKDGLRAAGLLQVQKLAWPVVSVGSLSAGGAGKTPVVITLAELLRARGWGVDLLSRGYGRKGRGVERVDVEVEDAARRFGDEPVVMARRAGVPVWVGADRYAAGVKAENFAVGEHEADSSAMPRNDKQGDNEEQEQGRNAGILRSAQNDRLYELRNDMRSALEDDKAKRVHLLDDGFQHRGLGRAVDVVVVTEEDLEEALLPAGNRREGLEALRRADAVVVRAEERERVEARARRWMRAGAAVWSVRRELRFADAAGVSSAGARPLVAFCGIARPEGFWTGLVEAGCELAGRVALGDHHAYSMADMERIVAQARGCGATGFITTEKDAVKLSAVMLERLLAVGPVTVAGLNARFVDEADVLRDLEARIG